MHYQYGSDADAGWSKLLTGVRTDTYNAVTGETVTGQQLTIDYDAIGNPVSYLGASLNWNGRELQSYSKNGTATTYAYDADGIRSYKNNGGVKSYYMYVNGQLAYEKRGDTDVYFWYDSYGNLAAIRAYFANGSADILMGVKIIFGILRIVIGIFVGAILFVIFYKHKQINRKAVSIVLIFVVTFITITGFIPFENIFYSFKSAEAVYQYYHYGETSVDGIIEGKNSDFVIGTKNNASTYLIVPKTASGWKLDIGLSTKKILRKTTNGITVSVYQYKNTSDYFIFILNTNGEISTVSDSYNTNFYSLERKNNSLVKTSVTYYAHISNFPPQYSITVNGTNKIMIP